ncbi:MAG: glucose 1-dehydrogenase [Proteobacteria bacterium]|nr:glucose 1-dehydrogenase [Pseudomonadota bacterium]
MPAGRVAGKVALVTGAASGLGRAIALMLAREGARLVVTDINLEGVQGVAAEIGESATAIAATAIAATAIAATAIAHDVTDPEQWQAVLDSIEADHGALDILVNNAGIGGVGGNVEETTLEDWRHLHVVDLDSVFLGCKLALPLMRRSGAGSIINISSIAGILADRNMAAYNSAKAAVTHLTKSVALHCARSGEGVRCNSLHPAFIDTPIIDAIAPHLPREELLAKLGRQIPLGHVGAPDDVAHAVLFLASDESLFITGTEIRIDGGISAM